MAIQKILPAFSGLFGYPDLTATITNDSHPMTGYGIGSPTTILNNSPDQIPYIRKSISAPDNSSFLSVDSGDSQLIGNYSRYYLVHQYDNTSIYPDSLTLRFIASGLSDYYDAGSEIQGYILTQSNIYDRIFKISNPLLSYSGNPDSAFVTYTCQTVNSFSIDKDLMYNLLQSGSHILGEHRIVKYELGAVSQSRVAFSAFEIEVSGHDPSKECPLYIKGFSDSSSNVNLSITGGYPNKSLDLYTLNANLYNNNISLVVDGAFPTGNVPMFISGDYVYNQLDMFTKGLGTYDNEISLLTLGPPPPSGNLNLFIKCDDVPTSGVHLYVENHSSVSGNSLVNLYTVSSSESSGDISLYMEGGGYGVDNDYINLFMYSKQPSGTLTLYTENHLASGNKSLNLYTVSYLSDSGELPLQINGGGVDLRQNELTLFTRSAVQNSGDVNLSIIGNLATGPINFYIKAEDVAKSSGLTDFYIFSALNSGIYNSFDITTKAGGHEASLPIYMPVESTGSQTSNINMVLLNDTTNNKDVLLYIENHTQFKSGSYTLFTQGNGTLNGGNVYSSSMDMFINRSDESLSSVVPMTIMGPSGITNTVPFVIKGGTISESGITLNMPSTASVYVNQFDIMTHGF